MKTVVCVVVFNRVDNVRRWLAAWAKWPQENAGLRIIHNNDNDNALSVNSIKALCLSAGVTYIPRANRGMDIGALQDVARKNLPGFEYDFDLILWATDDTLPMRQTWLSEFTDAMKIPGVGAACMELSPEVRQHMRTTGFMLRVETLPTLNFLVENVLTKEHCWMFEHKSDKNLFYQLLARGLACVQIAHLSISPMWDSGHKRHAERKAEYFKLFPEFAPLPPKVLIICTAFERYPMAAHSMIAQTFQNWEMYIVYDGAAPKGWSASLKDKRVHVVETKERRQNYGHPIRAEYLQKAAAGEIGKDCTHVLITNDDNYHAPKYLEKLIAAFEENTVATYSGDMVHSYKDYAILNCRPERAYIDCASVIIKKEFATAAGWKSMEHTSDWLYFQDVANLSGGFGKWVRVPGVHLVHN